MATLIGRRRSLCIVLMACMALFGVGGVVFAEGEAEGENNYSATWSTAFNNEMAVRFMNEFDLLPTLEIFDLANGIQGEQLSQDITPHIFNQHLNDSLSQYWGSIDYHSVIEEIIDANSSGIQYPEMNVEDIGLLRIFIPEDLNLPDNQVGMIRQYAKDLQESWTKFQESCPACANAMTVGGAVLQGSNITGQESRPLFVSVCNSCPTRRKVTLYPEKDVFIGSDTEEGVTLFCPHESIVSGILCREACSLCLGRE